MSEFISTSDIHEAYKWIYTEDPTEVEEIIYKGKSLKHAHIETFDVERIKGSQEHIRIFEALKNNRLRDPDDVRDFQTWCEKWERNRQIKKEKDAEERLQSRINRARQKAIDEIHRLRPNQLKVEVIQEESPSRIEEISDSNSEDSDLTNPQDVAARFGCCPKNTECDLNCGLIHF